MYVNFYTFAKRENSTKQPTGTGTQFNCVLKENTSVVNPTILIDHADQATPAVHLFNYAYISDFGRYYFISDQKVIRGLLWEYTLTCDILATYKAAISAATLYLLRCSSQYNGNVIDKYYPLLTSYTLNEQIAETPWQHIPVEGDVPAYYISIAKGCFVLGVLSVPESGGYGSYGSIKYIAIKYSQMLALISALMDNTVIENAQISLTDASTSLLKSIINPLSYIKSCYWVPFDYDDISGSEENPVKIWDWSIAADCKIITGQPMREMQKSFTLARHPAAATRGRYLNSDPYTNYTISYPPFGIINLNALDLIETPAIRIVTVVDYVTGVGRLEIYTELENGVRGRLLQKINAQVCVPIQLAEIGYDYTNLPATAIGIGAEALGGFLGSFANAVDSGLSSAVSQIGNAANAARTRTQSTGSSGNFSDLNGYLILTGQFYNIAAEDQAHVGRPLCANVAMTGVSSGSYCLAMDGDVAISGTAGEQQQLKAYLEGGFYYE